MDIRYRYKMWNTDFFTLKYADTDIKPFVFKDKEGTRDSLKIEEFDLITSRYDSFDSFYADLLKYGKYVDGTDKNIIITHEHKKKLYYDEMIFNDKMVETIASQVKNNIHSKKDSLLIPSSSSLFYFINSIEDFAVTSQYKYLLDPYNVKEITLNDMNILSSCVKGDIEENGKVVKKGIRSLLIEYREAYFKNHENINNGLANEHSKAEVDRLRIQIDACVRSSYKVFRDLVAWEKRYVKVLTKQFVDEKDNSKKLKLFKLIEDINMEKDLREGRIEYEDIYKYYEDYRNNIGISEDGRIKIDKINDIKLNANMSKQIEKISGYGRK